MSGRIPRSFIDELLVRIDIVDLIDKHVPLKKSGANFIARCPFHNEKTPSFTVSRSKQFYHCFGCGVSGNAISFLMDYSHLNFVEAIEELAAVLGLDVPRESDAGSLGKTDKENSGRLYELLQQVALCYAEQLRTARGREAVAYLKGRGVSGQAARDFQLGYAPDCWDFLVSRFDKKHLLEAGLLAAKETGRVYDRFRRRLMFPVRDRRGRVLGFGGRVLDDALPKYLNSPETPVFHKSREVYGLYELLAYDAKPKKILVTEGYLDVITLAQVGIRYAVACLGTAVGRAHIDLLFRFSRQLVFCFDGDNAGRQAVWRAIDAAIPCLRDGRQIHIMLLPEGVDPDSLVRDEGRDVFENRISDACSLSEYFFEHLSEDLSLQQMEGRAALVERAKPYLSRLPESAFRAMMFARLKELAKVQTLDVLDNPATLNRSARVSGKEMHGNRSPVRIAIALLLQNPELIAVVEQKNIDWTGLDMPGIALFKQIVRHIMDNPRVNTAALIESFRGLPEEKTVKALVQLSALIPGEGLELEFGGAVDRMLEQDREKGLEALIAKEQKTGLNEQERAMLLTLLEKKRNIKLVK